MKKRSTKFVNQFVGLDQGDRWGHYCVLDRRGKEVDEGQVRMSRTALCKRFETMARCRIVLEVGVHSPWISRLLHGLGHEVVVANARQVALIWASSRKSDRVDARALARLGRVDVELLRPIRHRSEAAQADRALLHSRDALVRSRTLLINHVRGTAKSFGVRLPKAGADAFAQRVAGRLPEPVSQTLAPVLETIAQLTAQIAAYGERVEQRLAEAWPIAEHLRSVYGVGALSTMAFLTTVEDPYRFGKSRDVGPYLGLTPGRKQSGQSDPQQRITKQGDTLVRRLFVQAAHQILQKRAPDSRLKRHGQRLIDRGGPAAYKRAVVAVARKLAVLLHHLWVTAELYEPLYRRAPAEDAA